MAKTDRHLSFPTVSQLEIFLDTCRLLDKMGKLRGILPIIGGPVYNIC